MVRMASVLKVHGLQHCFSNDQTHALLKSVAVEIVHRKSSEYGSFNRNSVAFVSFASP